MAGEYKLLLELMNSFGVSGKEVLVRDIIKRELRKHVNEIKIDKTGNLIAHQKGKGPRVMIAAHMDEVGLIVKNIEKDGKIRISTIGGLEPITLLNEHVEIKTRIGTVGGVITTAEICSAREVEHLPHLEDMFLDTGLTKKELLKRKVHVGSFISFSPNAKIIGENDIISGKGLDDRIGCYILIELAKKLKKTSGDIFFVFTVQEEVGLYGAKTSAYTINPEWALAIDVSDCDDREEHPSKGLGLGPVLTIKDSEMITNPCIDEWILGISKRNKINLQPDVSDAGTTDAMRIAISKGGVPSSVLGVCVRGLHTTTGLANLRDIDNAIRILYELLKKPPSVCLG